jgi:hypothetical protein
MPDDKAPTGATTAKVNAPSEYMAVLLELDRGRVHDDATERLAAVCAGVVKFGGKGKLTLTLEIEQQDAAADPEILVITPKVDATVPVPRRAAAIFYAEGRNGKITRQDPRRDDPRDRG